MSSEWHRPLRAAGCRVSLLNPQRVGEHVFGVDPGLTLIRRRVAAALRGLQSFFCCGHSVLTLLQQTLVCREISQLLYTFHTDQEENYTLMFISEVLQRRGLLVLPVSEDSTELLQIV